MYLKTPWKDHVVERPGTYTEVTNADGSKTYTPKPGEIIQQGTPQSATNFNNIEYGLFDVHLAYSTFVQGWLQFKRWIENVLGTAIGKLEADDTPEIKTVTLTNNQKWPFNNSQQTVSLATNRPTTNYTVDAEIKSVAGGTVQDVLITDRLANGFKVAFDGDAAGAVVKLIIKGGISR